jgi:predicted nucleic acid-binding Zn ribbon protein
MVESMNEISRQLALGNPNQTEKSFIALLLKKTEYSTIRTCHLAYGSKSQCEKDIEKYCNSHDLILVHILSEREFRSYIKGEREITVKVTEAYGKFYPKRNCVVCGKPFVKLGSSKIITCSKKCSEIRKKERIDGAYTKKKKKREIQIG